MARTEGLEAVARSERQEENGAAAMPTEHGTSGVRSSETHQEYRRLERLETTRRTGDSKTSEMRYGHPAVINCQAMK
jgi:hypothetical protein